MPDRGDVRGRMAKRARGRRILVAGFVAVLVGLLVWVIGYSPVLSVRQVRVDGTDIVPIADVITAAAVPMGQPLAQIDCNEVAARVTAALPGVASASVSRHWPSTLVIHVTERVIVYQIAVGGGYDWVSKDGVVFHSSSQKQDVLVASVGISDQTLLADVATVVAAIPDSLMPQVQGISASSRDSIKLALDGGRQVVWGSAEQSDLKAEVIVVLLANVPGKVYDISAPSNPAVR